MKKLFMVGGELGHPDRFVFKRWVKKNNIDYPRRGVDDFPVDYPPNEKILKESKKLGLFNCFRIPYNPTKKKILLAEPEKYYLIIDLFRATLDHQRPEVKKKFHNYHKFLTHYYDNIFNISHRYPERVWLCAFGEMDSCCPWPEFCFRTKEEAFKYWKKTFFTRQVGSNDPKGFWEYIRKRKINWRKENIMVQCGMVFSIHHYFHWGFRFVWLERGCGLSNLQMGIAFLRGGARQYNGLWGIDFSTHHPMKNQLTWYDEKGRRGGWSESLMVRSWLVAYLSGANLIFQESSNYTHWIFDSKKNIKLSPAGSLSKRFAEFVFKEIESKGEPYTPVAILVNFSHGYDGRHSCMLKQPYLWGGRMSLSPEDYHIDNLIEIFFPHHNQSWGMFEMVFNPDVPWKSQEEYLEKLKDGYDMRPFERGHIVNSPFGDIVDIIVDKGNLKKLEKYQIVFIGGLLSLKGNKWKYLKDYVKSGGILVGSYEQLSQEFLAEIGVYKEGGNWAYDIIKCNCCNKEYGGYRYAYSKLKVMSGKVLCENSKKIPLAWEISYGKGKVIVGAVPFFQDISSSTILPVMAHIFNKIVAPLCIISADPPLQIITSKGDGFILAGIFNNSEREWNGFITIQKEGSILSIVDIWNKKTVFKESRKTPFKFRDTVEPFGFKVYYITLTD